MQYTFAPMEGITNHLYRNAHKDCFTPADRYFIPFVSAKGKGFTGREKRDIAPEKQVQAVSGVQNSLFTYLSHGVPPFTAG